MLSFSTARADITELISQRMLGGSVECRNLFSKMRWYEYIVIFWLINNFINVIEFFQNFSFVFCIYLLSYSLLFVIFCRTGKKHSEHQKSTDSLIKYGLLSSGLIVWQAWSWIVSSGLNYGLFRNHFIDLSVVSLFGNVVSSCGIIRVLEDMGIFAG